MIVLILIFFKLCYHTIIDLLVIIENYTKNALAGNRTRVDNLGGYHSTSKLLALLVLWMRICLRTIL